jgi:hypothetical protein
MHPLIRWHIKTSLVYLALSLLVGVLLAAQALWNLPLPGLFPVYFHLLTIGWLTLLIFGVATWMFPRHSRIDALTSEKLGWTIFGLLNAGLLLRAVSEPMNARAPGTAWGWLLTLSALLQWFAGMLFVITIWGRVKEK